MTFTTWLAILGFIALAVQAHIDKEAIMAGVAEVAAAVDAARVEIEADKVAIIAEIERLGLPDEDTSALVAKVEALGSILDDVPGVTPVPPPDPEPSPEPTPEP